MNLNPKKNLRTFDHFANIKFKQDPNFNNKELICTYPKLDNKTLLYIESILTNQECDDLIKKSAPHYQTLSHEFMKDERDSNRVLADDEQFAKVLYDRIFSVLSQDMDLQPCGFGVKGKWKPVKINSCFRYNQYEEASTGFKPHRDATFIEHEDIRSILSILIYLNDDFTGGHTVFYSTGNRTKDQLVSDEMKVGYSILFDYKPKKGSVLIFDHNMIHAGLQLELGTKYIIRSDIIFQRIERPITYDYSWRLHPDFIEAIKLYREAMNQELDGNLEQASILYQKELAIRQCHIEY